MRLVKQLRFPARRALFNHGPYVLEAALMADGVAPADVYRLLSTPAGVDRAPQNLSKQLLTSPESYASAQGIAAMERFARFLQRQENCGHSLMH